MAYDDDEARSSRVVVETPTSTREVTQTETVRTPERDGISAPMVGVLVVVAIAVITILVIFFMGNQKNINDNANLAAQQQQQPPQTTIVQQPAAQQPPVIIQQPAAQQAPIVITQPAGGGTEAPANHDSAIQSSIDKQISEDSTLSSLGITATVIDGKVTLLGTVRTDALKNQVERVVKRLKGVREVDNQIVVAAA